MRKDFLVTLCAVAVLSLTNIIETKLGLFWTTWWADVLAHFLGGFAFGCIAWNFKPGLLSHHIWKLLFFVISVGVAWEIFELVFNITVMSDPGYWFDTMKDIMMDTIGGIAGYMCMIRINKN